MLLGLSLASPRWRRIKTRKRTIPIASGVALSWRTPVFRYFVAELLVRLRRPLEKGAGCLSSNDVTLVKYGVESRKKNASLFCVRWGWVKI